MRVSHLLILRALSALVRSRRRKACVIGIALLGSAFFAGHLASQNRPESATRTQPGGSLWRGVSMGFEPNRGQTDSRVRFLSRGSGYEVFLTEREAVLAFAPPKYAAQPRLGASFPGQALSFTRNQPMDEQKAAGMIRIQLTGDSPREVIQGESMLPGKVNYITGDDANKNLAQIETYARVRYVGVYRGIDLVYYGKGGELEYDFVVAPGADPSKIRMRIEGAENLRLSSNGSLALYTGGGDIVFSQPVVYQESGGVRHSVSGHFHLLAKNSIGFVLGDYNHAKPLIIDPVLAYSTYLGPSSTAIQALAVDQSGNAYVTGVTSSCSFPTTVGSLDPDPSCYSGPNVFVSKLSTDGSSLVYSTFLPIVGSGNAIAVDSSGDVYVAGQAGPGLPVTPGAYQPIDRAAPGANGFVLKLNSTGSAVISSTYIGGSTFVYGSAESDSVLALAIDESGAAYLAGTATSLDFPSTPGAFQTTDVTPGDPYSFAAKLDPSGSTLLYSTYLMGTGVGSVFGAPVGQANGIAIDSEGDAYLVGGTWDYAFPVTSGAFQTSYTTDPSDPGLFRFTGYVVKLDPTGSHETYASYLGGTEFSEAQAVAVDSSGDAYVTGWTWGGNMTTPGAFEAAAFGDDAYVVKISPSGSALTYGTYLGGTCTEGAQVKGDTGYAIALDTGGDAYIAGMTCSPDFPVTNNAIQTTLAGADTSYSAFFSELNANGSDLIFSTYIGGSYTGDWALGVGLDGALNAYIAGMTNSTSFPTTTGALQTQSNTPGAAFVSKFTVPQGGQVLSHDFSLSLAPQSATISRGQSATTTLTVESTNGFYESISLGCSGLPTWAQCSFAPAVVTLGPNSSTVTVTITTEPDSGTSSRHDPSGPLYFLPSLAALLWWFGRERRGKFAATLGLFVLLATTALAGCGSGGSGGTGGGGGSSFTATIVASAFSAEHSATFTVTAN